MCPAHGKSYGSQTLSPISSSSRSSLLRASHKLFPRHVHRITDGQRQPQAADPIRQTPALPAHTAAYLLFHGLKQGRYLVVKRAASFIQPRLASWGRYRHTPGSDAVLSYQTQFKSEVVLWVFHKVGVYWGPAHALGGL